VMAVQNLGLKKTAQIVIIGTNATINSRLYQKHLQKLGFVNLRAIATPLLVNIVEEGLYPSPILDEALQFYFKGVKSPDVIILACTHFPFLSAEIAKIYPNAKLIHSGEAIMQQLRISGLLSKKNKNFNTKLKLFSSSDEANFQKTAKRWLA
ncbi:MAG: glutamate racemase, partial [Deltaproteobacteria bacterium]